LLIISYPSPNFNERQSTARPNIVVIHYTATRTFEDARATLCNKESKVSAHYLISEDGTIYRLVNEAKRAWHAGVSKWGSITDINSYSIGIELSNDGFSPFGEKLMISLELLLDEVLEKWDIPACRVLAHSDVSPGRKIDPGIKFDWDRLALKRLCIKPKMLNIKSPNKKDFLKSLGVFGYNTEKPYETLLSAFRMRFNPLETGSLTVNDTGLAKALSLEYPVDLHVQDT
jgi:N-acetylmuramoyl-L-alanine amidase